MNLQDMYNEEKLKLIEDAGITIENRDYSDEEQTREIWVSNRRIYYEP